MTSDGVRDLTSSDLDWVLDLGAERRARLVSYAPRFWNPAPNARDVHTKFLGNKIADPNVLSIRTDHGFLFGYPNDDRYDVDDMVLDDESLWPADGVAMLRVAGADRSLNFGCPVPETERRAAAEGLGLVCAESWWHKDLDAAVDGTPPADRKITVEGASGLVLPAPPVYAPGGPVLLTGDVADAASLAAIEKAAAAAGAPVAVVIQQADQTPRAELLDQAGYIRTNDSYRGRLHPTN
ncbi:hypothetical protein FOE78_04815 [Microlunatus elymi]|uniref:Uncharacterized protein n=1 Tax=Microlunatus elymi TaxID=2596828 RepID=A0A516PVW0_9ACTN|nr:hypothetical protein [Microlunatus elymi]QDP95324.1 hypothetical protein FOE78_04815 [Microlunatus elymi]